MNEKLPSYKVYYVNHSRILRHSSLFMFGHFPRHSSKYLFDDLICYQKEAKNIKGKLNNESFVEKAPPAIVAKERDRLDELEATSAKLVQQKENIANL